MRKTPNKAIPLAANREEKDRPILWTEKEVSQFLGFSVRTMQAWRIAGEGPPFVRVSARAIRYRMKDIEAWIEDRLRTSTSDSDGATAGGRHAD